jgi:uncharacterized caspase-like protein
VTLKVDADLPVLKAEIAELRKKSKPGSVSLFFFSGHCWNLQNRNYLFGVDAPKAEDLLAGKNLDQVLLLTDVYDGIPGRMLVLMDTHGNPKDLPSAFLDLSQRVVDKTKGEQIPWVSRSISSAASWGH